MPERDGALLVLARRLSLGRPPSLSVLIARLEGVEEYGDFLALVREFLPEREQEILDRPTPLDQIAAFASHFEDRYFPLDTGFRLGNIEGYGDLTTGIPVIPLGISWDDYDDVSGLRPGIQLMTYLLASPYAGEDNRGNLAEACEEHVPVGLLQRVPDGGLSLAEAHRLLDGTRYRGLVLFGDVLSADTGNFFLDSCGEDLWNNGLPDWSRETIEELTRQWQRAQAIEDEIYNNLVDWLEESPAARFEELLNFILAKKE